MMGKLKLLTVFCTILLTRFDLESTHNLVTLPVFFFLVVSPSTPGRVATAPDDGRTAVPGPRVMEVLDGGYGMGSPGRRWRLRSTIEVVMMTGALIGTTAGLL
jgi:hypothetical protein